MGKDQQVWLGLDRKRGNSILQSYKGPFVLWYVPLRVTRTLWVLGIMELYTFTANGMGKILNDTWGSGLDWIKSCVNGFSYNGLERSGLNRLSIT